MKKIYRSIKTTTLAMALISTLAAPALAEDSKIQNSDCKIELFKSNNQNLFSSTTEVTPLYQYFIQALQSKGYIVMDDNLDLNKFLSDNASNDLLLAGVKIGVPAYTGDCNSRGGNHVVICQFTAQIGSTNGQIISVIGGDESGYNSLFDDFAKNFNSKVKKQIDAIPSCVVGQN